MEKETGLTSEKLPSKSTERIKFPENIEKALKALDANRAVVRARREQERGKGARS